MLHRGDEDPEEETPRFQEGTMRKSLVAITAALAMLCVGSLGPERAQAGGAMSAPTKVATQTATFHQGRRHRPTETADFSITEFSSSSAKRSVPQR
jgi:hypothetical protein